MPRWYPPGIERLLAITGPDPLLGDVHSRLEQPGADFSDDPTRDDNRRSRIDDPFNLAGTVHALQIIPARGFRQSSNPWRSISPERGLTPPTPTGEYRYSQ
jgi:hypothetical protein